MYVLSDDALIKAQKNCARLGYHLTSISTTNSPHLLVVAGCKIENHGGDSPTSIEVTYSVWTMNLDQDPSECLNSGYYRIQDLEHAVQEMVSRI